MHCGASLSGLQGALVFHRKSLGEKVKASNVHAGVCGGIYIAWVCAHLGFIVHTVLGVSNCWSRI